MDMTYGPESLHDLNTATSLEWLETNGVGGWAGSTVAGCHTRRYHGVLIAALKPPLGRTVLLSRLDERLTIGPRSHELGVNAYPGAVHPQGHHLLGSFTRGRFPTWVYEVNGARLRKVVAAIHGENTTLIRYELSGADAAELELLPLIAGRDYHALGHEDPNRVPEVGATDTGSLVCRMPWCETTLFVHTRGGTFRTDGAAWYRRLQLQKERERGFDAEEDLYCPGTLHLNLRNGEPVYVLVSTVPDHDRDPAALLEQEAYRRRELVAPFSDSSSLVQSLVTAADQFLVQRGSGLSTVLAGYHWFSDWGRDTMIALPGLCLATGRYDKAREILLAFADAVDRGMIPNRFPDEGETPDYNTVDATLWFVVAAYRYWKATGDLAFVRDQLRPLFEDIMEWHLRGTRYNIHVDAEGLLCAGSPEHQLTWMDAKVGDWVVTPRHGRAVEINALWYNAQAMVGELDAASGDDQSACQYRQGASRTRRAFRSVFWDPQLGYLRDVVHAHYTSSALRPNQLLALSLPFALLGRGEARSVLDIVERELLTPFGIRTLSASDPDYRGVCAGDPLARDGAYHQGTVWPWLLGPYFDAVEKVRGTDALRVAVGPVFRAVEGHLAQAGVGSVSEIFDGDPPHTPRGCIAQAWSVAELLRVALRLQQRTTPRPAL